MNLIKSKNHKWTKIKLALLSIGLSCLLFSCTSQKTKPNSTITINPNALNNSTADIGFWMVFALSQNSCAETHPAYSYGEFSCSFKLATLMLATNEEKQTKEKESQFQRDLKAVIDAGFLDEYLFQEYQQAHWFIPPKLRTNEYQSWKMQHIPNHKPGDPSTMVMERSEPEEIENVKEIQLGEDFIKEIGNLQFEKIKRYDNPKLGVSARYKMIGLSNGWLDFYVYPNLRFKENSKLVDVLADEASDSKLAILYQAHQDSISDMQVIEETYSHDSLFLTGIYEMKYENNSYANELYISGNQRFFLKARATFPFDSKNFFSSEVKTIFDSLLSNAKYSD